MEAGIISECSVGAHSGVRVSNMCIFISLVPAGVMGNNKGEQCPWHLSSLQDSSGSFELLKG